MHVFEEGLQGSWLRRITWVLPGPLHYVGAWGRGRTVAYEQPEADSGYLQRMILESSEIESFLNALTHLAVHELSDPGEEVLCGITLLRHKRAATVASSSQEAQDLDEIQYSGMDGPCLNAAREQMIIHIPDLDADGRWAEYARNVAARGIRTVLAIPFQLEQGDQAALNLYGKVPQEFTTEKVTLAQGYASEASQAFAIALKMARHQDTAADAVEALKSRTTIDLAVGMIMGQNNCSQSRAVEILKAASSTRNIKLRQIAAAMIAQRGQEAPDTHFEA